MTIAVGIHGTEARWRPLEQGELDEYALPKCPECGSPDVEICTNWKPEPGLDSRMVMVRCMRIKDVVEHQIVRCHVEYFLAPVMDSRGARSRGTVV